MIDVREVEVNKPVTMVHTYHGKQYELLAEFKSDVTVLSEHGYRPISQNWIPGERDFASVVIAILLCFVVIGFAVLIYYWLVKPSGSLTVIYELRQ